MKHLTLSFCCIAFTSFAIADPVKKGRVMCEGPACTAHDVPTGSFVEKAGEFADDFVGRVKRRIDIAKEPENPVSPSQETRRKKKVHTRISSNQNTPGPNQVAIVSNLPVYYQGIDHSDFEANEKVVFVPKSSGKYLKGVAPGDVIWTVIEQEIVASPSVPTPVRAMAIGGLTKGGIFLGEATLDRELKRVCISFNKLRLKDHEEVYSLKASALSPRGSVCLEGEYISQTGKFFIAELASAATAGFLDSTVNRNQSALGAYIQEPSLANSGKSAAVTALSKTTERMAENARNAPEYTRIAGYQEIQIIIQEDPVETGQ